MLYEIVSQNGDKNITGKNEIQKTLKRSVNSIKAVQCFMILSLVFIIKTIIAIKKKTKKMNKDQEEEIREYLKRFRADSSPLMHVLSLHSYFFNKLAEDKTTLEEFLVQKRKLIEEAKKFIEEREAKEKDD